jgi:hypothetical protein
MDNKNSNNNLDNNTAPKQYVNYVNAMLEQQLIDKIEEHFHDMYYDKCEDN